MIITIDGPAASGKGTLARRLAQALGYAHLDTGALYRAVGLSMLRAGHDLDDAAQAEQIAGALDLSLLEAPALREQKTGQAASAVARYPGVRTALLQLQRGFAATPPGAVLDGRDTGSVGCPNADVKLYVDAAVTERARRRAAELQAAGKDVSQADVEAELAARDAQDKAREEAPLVVPDGAVQLDTTRLSIEDALEAALKVVSAKKISRQTGAD
ncbi:MAG: (d)CMP kinase [Sphingomonadales bacterium]